MPDTGAPWNIPYVAPTDNPRVYPAADEAQALAVAAGLTDASRIKQVKQVITTANFTTSSTTMVDLTGVTVSLTPQNAANRVMLLFSVNFSSNNNNADCLYRYSRDSTLLFEEVSHHFSTASTGRPAGLPMVFDEVADNTTARDYKVVARTSTGTMTVLNSALIVIEYAP